MIEYEGIAELEADIHIGRCGGKLRRGRCFQTRRNNLRMCRGTESKQMGICRKGSRPLGEEKNGGMRAETKRNRNGGGRIYLRGC